jgi:16S rRNA (guanine(527)-N(7))-methyltransferase RsmG
MMCPGYSRAGYNAFEVMDTELFLSALKTATDALGVPLTEAQAAQCADFAALVVETNKTLNLTRITEPEAMAVKHFADSLTLLKAVPELKQGATVCDVGTGAGFPGVPLKIVRPDLQLTLVDSLRKRLSFLEGALETLGVTGVTRIHTRAEELKQARFDLVTARAVAALPKLIAWCAPLVKPGGLFVALKGAEVEDDEGAAAKAGLTLVNHLVLTLPDAETSRRNLLVWVK